MYLVAPSQDTVAPYGLDYIDSAEEFSALVGSPSPATIHLPNSHLLARQTSAHPDVWRGLFEARAAFALDVSTSRNGGEWGKWSMVCQAKSK